MSEHKMEPSEEQKEALQVCFDKLLSDTPEPVFLTGPGGAGKSFCMSYFIEKCIDEEYDPILCAPTHVARERLIGMHPDIEPITIQKYLGYRPKSMTYGEQNFDFMDDNVGKFKLHDILIVDEASMLTEIFVEKCIDISRGRVLFCGDVAQIPPVTSDDKERTKLLKKQHSEPSVAPLVKNVVELKKVFRQKEGSNIFSTCQFLRNSILKEESLQYYNDKSVFLEDIRDIIREKNDKTVFTSIKPSDVVAYLEKNKESVFIAFGNPTVEAVQKKLSEWYKDGGRAITNGVIMSVYKDQDENMISKLLLGNNSHVDIVSIKKKEKWQWGVYFDSVALMDEDGKVYDAYVPSNPSAFDKIKDEWIEQAKLNDKNKNKSSFNEEVELSNYSLCKFLGRVITVRDSRVSTVHRAQGLQWKNVIVMIDNIYFSGVNMDKSLKDKDTHRKIIAMKMLYTAVSRAKEKLLICNGISKNF